MTPQVMARRDPALTARIVRSTPLFYDDDPSAPADRPAYVRAGSSLTVLGDYVAVVQDDANFVALIDVRHGRALSLPLPAGPHGARVFDKDHGNKQHKFDLEACVTIPGDDEALLVAFGSGTNAHRERIVVVRWRPGGEPRASVHDGSAFYTGLRAAADFAGSALNVEGAVYLGDNRVQFFQRGNGQPRGDLHPVDATCELAWSALWAYLQQPGAPPPAPQQIVQYRLGEIDGHQLNFSDAEAVGGAILYSASSEESAGTGRDGAIGGSVLGVIDGRGARYATLVAEDDGPFQHKIEGLSVSRDDPMRAYFVVDDDDAEQPSALFEVELSGPWYR